MKKISKEHQDIVNIRIEEAEKKPESMLDWNIVSELLEAGYSEKIIDPKKFIRNEWE